MAMRCGWAFDGHFSHLSHWQASTLLLNVLRSPHSNTKNQTTKTAVGSVSSRRRMIASLLLGFPLASYCDCRTRRCHVLVRLLSSLDVA